jgi:hypothetical protein
MAVDTNNISTQEDEGLDLTKLDRGDALDDPVEGEPDALAKTAAEEALAVEEGEAGKTEGKGDPDEDRLRDDKGRFVPAYRAKEMVAKEREARESAERRLAELEKRLQQEGQGEKKPDRAAELEAQVEALLVKQSEYLADGDADRATTVQREIRALDRQIVLEETASESRRIAVATLESDRVDLVIARLEAEHSVLNAESPEFDPAIANFILAEQRRLVGEGMAPSKALLKAGEDIIARFVTPGGEGAGEPKKGLTNITAERRSEQVKKNLDTSTRQPGSLKSLGADSDKHGEKGGLPDVAKLSEEEFDALPESTKARMRGDSL